MPSGPTKDGDAGSKPQREEKKSGEPAVGSKPDASALSQSGMSSSIVDTSEDEEAKKKEAAKAAKQAKKGLS